MTLTTDHLVSFFTGGLALYGLLRVVAPLTKTTRDDEALAALDRGKTWVANKAPGLWVAIEMAGRLNALPAGVSKAIWYLEQIRKAYYDAHKSEIPKDLEAYAQKLAAEMSRGAKNA
jgi:hypothetical protein